MNHMTIGSDNDDSEQYKDICTCGGVIEDGDELCPECLESIAGEEKWELDNDR